jgi:hypothetical protein
MITCDTPPVRRPLVSTIFGISTAIALTAWLPAQAGAVGTTYAVGDAPSSVALADWNGDGLLDAGVANETSKNVSILLGDGVGGFQFPVVPQVHPVLGPPVAIAGADLNHDGLADFVTADSSAGSIGLVSAGLEVDFNAGAEPRGIAIGDLNRGDDPDIAVTDAARDKVRVLFGDGNLDYASRQRAFKVGDDPRGVAVADLDRDGHEDLLVANRGDNDLTLLFGTRRGGFGDRTDLRAGKLPVDVTVGRFIGKGKLLDPLVANETPDVTSISDDFLSLYKNRGKRRFDKQIKQCICRARPVAVATGDTNADGLDDPAAAYFLSGRIGVFISGVGSLDYVAGDGPGTITPTDVAMGNLDADAGDEIVSTDSGNDEINVYGGS